MKWSDVGEWIKGNAGTGAALVGSLITGNIPGAVAAGVSLVSSATGTNDPGEALIELQGNPDAMVKLKELQLQNEQSIREHIRAMTELELADNQAEHQETGKTVRAGDSAADRYVRWTRPTQSSISLLAAIAYVFNNSAPSFEILGLLLSLPWAYAGLRQLGKGVDSFTGRITNTK